MKKTLSCILSLLTAVLTAQTLTLTQSFNEPVPGDTVRMQVIDTSAYASGLPNISGANVVWNFQQLVTTTTQITSAYVPTTAVSSSSNYPSATFVQKQAGANNFFKSASSPTTQTEFLGISSSSMSLNFTNTAVAARYPITYGNSWTDNFSGPFTFSVSGTATGSVNAVADGSGTLHLPYGNTLTNVLRVKTVQTMTFNSGFFPLGTMKQVTYNYYHAAEKFPVLSISYNSFTQSGSTPTLSGSATGKLNYLVGLTEQQGGQIAFSIFPNPAQQLLHVKTGTGELPSRIVIYDLMGAVRLHSGPASQLNIADLPSGIYLIEAAQGTHTARQKFIKQ